MTAVRSLVQCLRIHADRLGERAWLRTRRLGVVSEISWRAADVQVRALAAGLIERGIERGDRVVLLSENRPEWVIADLAIQSAGGVSVPMHAPLSAARVRRQIADSGAKAHDRIDIGPGREGQAADLCMDDFAWPAPSSSVAGADSRSSTPNWIAALARWPRPISQRSSTRPAPPASPRA